MRRNKKITPFFVILNLFQNLKKGSDLYRVAESENILMPEMPDSCKYHRNLVFVAIPYRIFVAD